MTKIQNNAASRFVAAPSLILTGTQALLLPVILSTLIVTRTIAVPAQKSVLVATQPKENIKRAFDSFGTPGFTGFDKRSFDSFTGSGFTGLDKRSFDSFVGKGFTGMDKRAFDSFVGQIN
uniref:Uncharacterized protein n=1 Tax=Meloidogyne incognita TaxID=6306 RepID=A0A914NS93_MELIC